MERQADWRQTEPMEEQEQTERRRGRIFRASMGVADGGVGGVLTPVLFITGGFDPPEIWRFFQMFMKNCVIFMSTK